MFFSQHKTAEPAAKPAYGTTSGQDESEKHSSMAKVLKDFRDQIKKGLPLSLEPGTLVGIVDAIKHSNAIDDRKFLLEHILVILSKLPAGTDLTNKLQNAVVTLLYNDLAHPPPTYISNQYAWRTADGSYNNVSVPDMGKAHTPYSRSVQQEHPLPKNMMPDASLVFDTLLKREKFVKHPAGLSSLMFSFAALVIHTCFRTSHSDWTINETSSYVDLAPLYGHDQKAQDMVRVRDGRGLLHPDSFAEDRLLLLPPAVCVLLVLFSRNHNYIARKLVDINERGTWVDPATIPESDPQRRQKIIKQEEEIFQTARLVNCGWFANVVFSDYFSAILGLVRQGSSWSLNPFEEIRKSDHSFVERGQGNACSVEFNCLYRWHATTSVEDEKWIEQAFGQIFKGKSPDTITPMDFKEAASELQKMEPDCEHWTFGNLKRQDDGHFKDEDLAGVLQDSTSHPASAFKARGTPHVMRLHEIMGIEQSRRWGVCSLNDFRKYLGLKTYDSFLEWNPDPEIANAASKLYGGDINNLELYAGLQAEEAKPVIEGAGLCPGYTISRAILADAISLTRGDRFYTTDMTPHNYTAWGLKDCSRDTANAGFGSMLGRLFLRTLPEQYTSDSSYTWFPLMTPDAMKGFTETLGVSARYNFDRPRKAPATTVVNEYEVVKAVLKDEGRFRPPYADRVGAVTKGQGYFIALDQTAAGSRTQKEVVDIMFKHAGSVDRVAQAFGIKTQEIIARESYFLSGRKTKNVDISDVLKAVPIQWVATEIAGLPLKTDDDDDDGLYTDDQLHSMLGDLYSFLFLEIDPAHELTLEERVKTHTEDLLRHIRANVRTATGGRLSFFGIVDSIQSIFSSAKRPNNDFMEKLGATGKSTDELANSILSTAVSATVELSQALVNMVNLYLQPQYASHRKQIEALARGNDAKSEAQLQGYAREALRLDPAFAGVFREARSPQQVSGLSVQENSRLFLSVAAASRNEKAFPNPQDINPGRAASTYLNSDAASRALGNEFVYKVMAHVLRTVFSLNNLRRAPGQSGVLKRFPYNVHGTEYYQYLDKNNDPVPWVTSMVLQYDA